MQSEEDRRRDVGIGEVVDAGINLIERADPQQGHRGRRRHEGDREEIHHDEAHAEQEGVNVGPVMECQGDLHTPGHVGRSGQDENGGEQAERERRRVEDVCAATVPGPAYELLPQKADRDHRELQVEPLVAEPDEKVGAENDRKRPETQDPLFPTAPTEKGVERVSKNDLCEDQAGFIVNVAPVPSPVSVDCELNGRLDVVMLVRDELELQASSLTNGRTVEAV